MISRVPGLDRQPGGEDEDNREHGRSQSSSEGRILATETVPAAAAIFGWEVTATSDPMTYLDYTGDRTFQNEMASCGEYADRACGINGTTCRRRQNSVALLTERLGARGAGSSSDQDPAGQGIAGGCTAAGGAGPGALALALVALRKRRRR